MNTHFIARHLHTKSPTGNTMNEHITFFSEDITFEFPNTTQAAEWLQNVIEQEGHSLHHINIIFCSDNYLHAHNVQYLQHDTLTDVITFDHSEEESTLEGDIYISIERVKDNAQELDKAFLIELHTVMVHGVLHLLGYQDDTPEAKAIMRQKEATYVAQLSL